eukprot:Phypoly_transcript_12085.p1 GENE.Phypoly_transcript_12085~~Phypoly_transcript_12085.p1  ORF type:complete len:382 (+),score=95.88 Phypoly_transcript_12085:35-1147(+)
MGERKVLNKYYPPDFDPAKIPKVKRPKNDQVKVRMMLPMSIRCNTCGEYLYKGKKFNSRKETVTGEEYLGIKIFRFYIKCTRCSAELTIKTDPKNSDYQCEWGASRNFEPWRENKKFAEEQKGKREKEEMGDAMKALENRTHDSKVEMDILDALDEIRSLNARQSKMDPIQILLQKQKEEEEEQQRLNEEDEALVRELYGGSEDGVFVKRIAEPENDDEYGSDYETEDAMKSLLITKVDGMELFNAAPKKVRKDASNGDEPASATTAKNVTPIVKVEPKIVPKVEPKIVPKVVPKIVPKVTPKIAVKSSGTTKTEPPKTETPKTETAPKKEEAKTETAPKKEEAKTEAPKKEASNSLSSLAGYGDDSDEN